MNENTLQGIGKLVSMIINWIIKRYTNGKETSKRNLYVWKNNFIKKKNARSRRAMLNSVDELLSKKPTDDAGK